jgi:TolA-binding protein
MLSSIALGNIGDAFVEINQPEDAYDYYLRAANVRDNNFTTPYYLFKAGNVAMELEKFEEAEKHFNKIKNEYSKSEEAKSINIFIQRAQIAQK